MADFHFNALILWLRLYIYDLSCSIFSCAVPHLLVILQRNQIQGLMPFDNGLQQCGLATARIANGQGDVFHGILFIECECILEHLHYQFQSARLGLDVFVAAQLLLGRHRLRIHL